MPFGGEPWADLTRREKRDGKNLSPVPFGGEPWADRTKAASDGGGREVTSAFRRRAVGGQRRIKNEQSRDVTSAFRRRAVGGRPWRAKPPPRPPPSPVPFGGEPWAEPGRPLARDFVPGHQCLSAESRGRKAFERQIAARDAVTSAFRRRAVGGGRVVYRLPPGPVTSAFRRRAVGGLSTRERVTYAILESPVPFGGEPWAERKAEALVAALRSASPVPFGGEPWAERSDPKHVLTPPSHQCLSAESRGRIALPIPTAAPRRASPVPFGGEPWAECRGRTLRPLVSCHQCLSAESRGRTLSTLERAIL